MGNIFAIRPGENNDLPPIGLGSHLGEIVLFKALWLQSTDSKGWLDTQPAGGKYDGIVGVLCALEALRVIHENNIRTFAPIVIINWTNEEGARFSPALLGSGVWCGMFDLDFA